MPVLAIFDFDGTLCQSDSFTGFMRYRFSRTYFYKKCLSISPQITAYYAGVYPAHLMRPLLFKKFFAHQSYQKTKKDAEQYVETQLIHELNSTVLAKLRWHQQQKHQVAIVSASIELYLKPLSKYLQVDLICTQVEHQRGRLTGAYASKDCSCDEKVSRIHKKYDLSDFEQIYVYGNSNEDHAMLNVATDPYWINKQFQILPFEGQKT